MVKTQLDELKDCGLRISNINEANGTGFVGTVMYASPEQIAGSSSIDHRSDIYRLGCILYELHTGTAPFTGDLPQYIAYQHTHEPTPPIVPRDGRRCLRLDKIIYRCLEKNPDSRYQDYNSLAADIIEKSEHIEGICDFLPSLRYKRSVLGADTFRETYIKSVNARGYGIISFQEMDTYIHEALSLISLERFNEAESILEAFYIPELVVKLEKWNQYIHTVAVNYALCLSTLKADQSAAISVYERISSAQPKSPEYYINYSLALIRAVGSHFRRFDQNIDIQEELEFQQKYRDKGESILREGLALFPTDVDLLGNLAIIHQLNGQNNEALATSFKRLNIARDVHSLEETGSLLILMADAEGENWPQVTKYLKTAVQLLFESKEINPRYFPPRVNLMAAYRKLFRFGDATDEVHEIYNNAEKRDYKEMAICTQAELLNDVRSYSECIEFCDSWIDKITTPFFKSNLRHLRYKVAAEHFCLGLEQNGQRIILPEVLKFFEEATKENNFSSVDDLVFYARLIEWVFDSAEAAEDWFTFAENKAPNYWHIYYEKAMFLFRIGKTEESIHAINNCINLAPYRPEPLDRLSQILTFFGKDTDANHAKRKADEIFQLRLQLAKGN